jgi:cytochrome c oxidase subunit 2
LEKRPGNRECKDVVRASQKGWRKGRGWTLAVTLMVTLAACAENAPQDFLEPEGPVARRIDRLQEPVFIVAGLVFVLVQGLVLFAMFKFRDRPGRAEPRQVHGNTRLEVGWTLLPALILFVIAIPTIKTIFDLSRTDEDALQVKVIGHQFWWEYQYEDSGIVTANELVMPAGRPVELTLESVDVIHSYWVPKLAGKTDVIPGRVNRMSFEADDPGRYPGQCSEFCGISHANMRNVAVALSPADFDRWVADHRRPAATPPDGSLAAEGLTLFTGRGCGGCHRIEGVSEGGIGPNLTHFASRETFAGSIFENTPDDLRTWLRDPQAAKPGNLMQIPGAPLTSDEITKLIAYLETLN